MLFVQVPKLVCSVVEVIPVIGASNVKVTSKHSLDPSDHTVPVLSSQSPYSMSPLPETGGTEAFIVTPVEGLVKLAV